MTPRAFPPDFLWGVATSAYQIEGSLAADGRGESIWERFAALPGRIEDGSNALVACDHYRRWREDLELIAALGVGAYRFSIAWPRVMPAGRGVVNSAGLDFYDALVDELLAKQIRPFVTLYHWDLPQAMQDLGGWASRDTAHAFVDYATVVAKRLGDRVKDWATHNEPWCVANLGHEQGKHAPGHQDPHEALRVAHHLLLSHGWATEAIRACVPESEIGLVTILSPGHPASSSKADREAVRRFDGEFNRWYLEPIFCGRYPEDALEDRVRRGHLESQKLPFVENGDMRVIATRTDFLGLNYYARTVLRAGDDGEPEAIGVVPAEQLTDMGWEVYPDGLYESLRRVANEYRPAKIYVTESGAAYADGPDESGRIVDDRRIEYLRGHLQAAARAIADGVPLQGYFAWSLLDNFEWAHGYSRRFGLYWVDYASQLRVPKQSALWYRDVVASGARDLFTP